VAGLAGQPTKLRFRTWVAVFGVVFAFTVSMSSLADDWNPGSKAPNKLTDTLSNDGLRIGGIANTRHNLTQSYTPAFSPTMDRFRNNYYEVCVYCHTPHAANSTAAAPLWNRTVTQRTYELYRQPTMLGQAVSQPGPNSLTCLSCHDGATAIDSIINMPTRLAGAFRAGYKKEQETAVNFEFLDKWEKNSIGTARGGHAALNSQGRGNSGNNGECLSCHNGGIAPDFSPFIIGGKYTGVKRLDKDGFVPNDPKDGRFLSYTFGGGSSANALYDDHPIGVRYPDEFGRGVDYNEPTVKKAKIAFFDLNGNNHADPNEIRLYDTGDGYEVECGSCHDPHGVRIAGTSDLVPSFLRVGAVRTGESGSIRSGNSGSQLCLTCHVK